MFCLLPALVLCAALAGCGSMAAVDQSAVDAAAPGIEAQIVAACTGSGLFKAVGGAAAVAVPVAALPVAVVSAGVDQVCANPARYARDASTAAWVVRNLRDILAARAAAQR